MAGTFDALDRATTLVDQLAAKLAAAEGLNWNVQCPYEAGQTAEPAHCDSDTCVAAHYEDHDPSVARANYRRCARVALAFARDALINTPETADFMAGIPLEAAHQRERWGVEQDAGKSPFDWFWLIGYLSQKAADAAVRGDVDKALHHTISTGATLANWHAALSRASTTMRPGIDPATVPDSANTGGQS